MALSPDKKFLYSVHGEFIDEGRSSQQVNSYSINPKTGTLTLLNSQPSEGMGPCHLSVHPSGKYLFTANYNSGSIAVHPINGDGSLSSASDVIQHTGSGPDKERQESAHAHFICPDPQGSYVLAVDLGMDKIMNYTFDITSGELHPNPHQPFFKTKPGAGPRHLDFHPSENHLFILNELNGTIIACRYDTGKGVMSEINTLNTLQDDFSGFNKSAAIRVHPGGHFVYASNRGDLNSIAAFSIKEDGSIAKVQIQDGGINWPRDFNIDPTGQFLLAENQRGNNIVVFKIDPSSGKIIPTKNELKISQPTCIVFTD